jgi:hypothetical protein
MNQTKDFIILNLVFFVLCLLVLLGFSFPIGQALFGLCSCYVLMILGVMFFRKYQNWMNIFQFSFAFGIFNFFPDWFLSAHLKTLIYPEEGIFKIGIIGGYMPLLWFIPMFMLLWGFGYLKNMIDKKLSYLIILILGIITFSLSEHCFKILGSWHAAESVKYSIGNAAVYVLLSELMLIFYACYLFEMVEKKSISEKIIVAFTLMILYMGSLIFWWFVLEGK